MLLELLLELLLLPWLELLLLPLLWLELLLLLVELLWLLRLELSLELRLLLLWLLELLSRRWESIFSVNLCLYGEFKNLWVQAEELFYSKTLNILRS